MSWTSCRNRHWARGGALSWTFCWNQCWASRWGLCWDSCRAGCQTSCRNYCRAGSRDSCRILCWYWCWAGCWALSGTSCRNRRWARSWALSRTFRWNWCWAGGRSINFIYAIEIASKEGRIRGTIVDAFSRPKVSICITTPTLGIILHTKIGFRVRVGKYKCLYVSTRHHVQ